VKLFHKNWGDNWLNYPDFVLKLKISYLADKVCGAGSQGRSGNKSTGKYDINI
jgi:hypothetical protein